MNLHVSFRKSVVIAAAIAVSATGCRGTCPKCQKPSGWNLPGRSHHSQPEPLSPAQPLPPYDDVLILPTPSSSQSGSSLIEPQPAPPTLPPFEEEVPVPSAGLTPIRRMSLPPKLLQTPIQKLSHEVSGDSGVQVLEPADDNRVSRRIIRDANLTLTGCAAPVGCSTCVTACSPCPPACDPCLTSCDPCCEPLTSKLSRHLASARCKATNMTSRVHHTLSSLNPLSCGGCGTCDPCLTCDPCGPCGGMVLDGVVVGEYPLSSCATCNGMPAAAIPYGMPTYQPAGYGMPYPQAGLPSQPPCACQHQGHFPGASHGPAPHYPHMTPPQYGHGPAAAYGQQHPAYNPQPQYPPQAYYQQQVQQPQFPSGQYPPQHPATGPQQYPQTPGYQPYQNAPGAGSQSPYQFPTPAQPATGGQQQPVPQPVPQSTSGYSEPQPVSPQAPSTASYQVPQRGYYRR